MNDFFNMSLIITATTCYLLIGVVYGAYLGSDKKLKADKKERLAGTILWPIFMPITILRGLTIFAKVLMK